MLKKIILPFCIIFSSIGVIYPSNKEDTNIFDYCYSLEKILIRNSIKRKNNLPEDIKSYSNDILKFGISKTKGDLINRMIEEYKNSKDSLIIKMPPNKIYCLAGYWIEKVKPGIFESIFYEKSKKTLNEYKNLRIEVDEFIKEIDSEYKFIKEDFNKIFN